MKTTFQQSLNIPFTVEVNKAFRGKTKQKPSVTKGRVNNGTAMRKEIFDWCGDQEIYFTWIGSANCKRKTLSL